MGDLIPQFKIDMIIKSNILDLKSLIEDFDLNVIIVENEYIKDAKSIILIQDALFKLEQIQIKINSFNFIVDVDKSTQ